MKYLRLFESNDISTWEEDFLSFYDIFCELEDRNIGSFDYQAGWRDNRNNNSYVCFLRDEKIMGRKDSIDSAIMINSKVLFRVLISPHYKNGNHSPFDVTNGVSFFGQNADLFIEIIGYVKLAKSRLVEYEIGITTYDDLILINFLKNKL